MAVNIQAIEKSVMTTTDEKMLKQMAESMPYEIYQQLSPEARSRLAKAYRKEVPAASPYTGVLPMKKAPTFIRPPLKEMPKVESKVIAPPKLMAHRKLTEIERDRMIDLWAHAPLTYRSDVDDELMKLGLIRWYDEEKTAVENTEVPFYDRSGRILPEWYDFKQETSAVSPKLEAHRKLVTTKPIINGRTFPAPVIGALPADELKKMMDDIAAVVARYGYKNLGYQQTLSGEDVLRFIKGRNLVDVVAEFDIDQERYEAVMQFEEQG